MDDGLNLIGERIANLSRVLHSRDLFKHDDIWSAWGGVISALVQAIEAGTGETERLDAQHESAVRKDAPTL